MGNPMRTAMDRLYSIAIGGFVAVLVNVLVCPIWAGEQLHKELVNSFDSVAASLEECVGKYLEDDGSEHPEFSKTVMDEFPDEPAYRKCRSTLNSSAKLEALAVSAKWEPPHGRFRHFFYPWSEYVKVAAVLRYCAYELWLFMVFCTLRFRHRTTSGLHSSRRFGRPQARLQSWLSQTLTNTFSDLPNQLADLDSSNSLETNSSQQLNPSTPQQMESNYHELMRKQSRRLHYSWPPLQVDAFEEEGSAGDFLPRMKALESTAALSLATFTSLLIEFVARLDHLVEAVDELSKLAKF
ncbi:aluminum-activated malate transporter 9-like [Prunus yedoensis var. nudiflora]|uniref:Aluminum-activated malate transporter 9-like n=1 Tax=Prunus yedoensis var. nudiflora TaxID=2094558 RepID=A0A314UJI9_PRUYE|nr:aluminum-activated malate transporter 9-like [Prunus yedoensis var. nudiflora]